MPPKKEDKKEKKKEAKRMAEAASSSEAAARARAEEFKNRGNAHVAEKQYQHALVAYSAAIKLFPRSAVYYSNRALVRIQLEEFMGALQDATMAVNLDTSYTKAYYRRATANFSLGKFKEALKDLKMVVKIAPNDPEALQKFKACEAEVARQEHELELTRNFSGRITENMNLAAMEIETSYTGPRMGDDNVLTLEFVTAMLEEFKSQRLIHRKYAFTILAQAKRVLAALPNVVEVPVPEFTEITVCGDTHGQFYDLLNIFAINGSPSESNPYVFNGDYVDRGAFGVEIMLTLLAYKVLYPNSLHLTRGNHESRFINITYGFAAQVRSRYNDLMFEVFQEIFNQLPLAIVLNGKAIVLHGGLFGQDNVTIADINRIDRTKDIPEDGVMCEILWSDPQHAAGCAPSLRGAGVRFGPDITDKFLRLNNLELLVRSHEAQQEGFDVNHHGKCITIFSAPNYCDQYGNKGAFIRFGPSMKPKFTQFPAVPHPIVDSGMNSNEMRMLGMM